MAFKAFNIRAPKKKLSRRQSRAELEIRAKSLDLPPTSVRSVVLRFLEQNHLWNFDDVWEDAIGTKLIKRALQEDRTTRGLMEIFELSKKQHKIRPIGITRYLNELVYVLRNVYKSTELKGFELDSQQIEVFIRKLELNEEIVFSSDYHLLYSLLSYLGWDVFQDSYSSTVYLQWKCLELDLRVNLDTFSNYSKIESGHFVMVITLTKSTPIELVLTQLKTQAKANSRRLVLIF
ncbi:Oidioi.mRNA.OKI2018_I69.PAR.g11962.t1.cds [Oikopleura dioica]|uniref:Oidioi.mRNA.OKI2018_I69.PAR.g11962.t1.cds n=1 Tax=Oikopleura dioica TaxID=34765 RepID=A0ABN7S1M6_OIKDI|nr:Oidioi.mRNA.OKI2018_I69.PAR.g11962.t1.cds [Oikopleura dioica]